MNITVLGAGMVGSAIARDLAQESAFSVTAVDRDGEALGRLSRLAPVATTQADLSDGAAVPVAVNPADLLVCAVPGFLGFQTLKAILQAGKNVVDISFFPEEAFLLDDLAREKGVTAVVDCGVAPGLCNIMAGHAVGLLDEAHAYSCYVGGLPVVRTWPYEYRSVFSPVDVLEEYTRPARQVEHGQEVVLPALSEVELLDFPGVGTLEAFNTDGLRTLRHTLRLPSMKEKTLRYPGHANLMRVFRESGFFGAEPLDVRGQMVRPVDLTSRLLFEQWRPTDADQQEDITIMQVVVEGSKDGRPTRHTFYLLDHYDRASGVTAMARTTGYTCAIVARQVASGLFARRGICPPEYLGQTPGCWEDLMAGYAARGIHVEHTVSGG
ncbi:MAG: saccharopine dehydrogenase C-terminal domain-containing protein [Chloroflexota bacterium]|nr:saccharopine dehydrogenase C-terminal domain-containing protein [Chloroflexota bacterium]